MPAGGQAAQVVGDAVGGEAGLAGGPGRGGAGRQQGQDAGLHGRDPVLLGGRGGGGGALALHAQHHQQRRCVLRRVAHRVRRQLPVPLRAAGCLPADRHLVARAVPQPQGLGDALHLCGLPRAEQVQHVTAAQPPRRRTALRGHRRIGQKHRAVHIAHRDRHRDPVEEEQGAVAPCHGLLPGLVHELLLPCRAAPRKSDASACTTQSCRGAARPAGSRGSRWIAVLPYRERQLSRHAPHRTDPPARRRPLRRPRRRHLRHRTRGRAHPAGHGPDARARARVRAAAVRTRHPVRGRPGPRGRARGRAAVRQAHRARPGERPRVRRRRPVHRVQRRAQLGQGARHPHARLRARLDADLPPRDAEGGPPAHRVLGPRRPRRAARRRARRHDPHDPRHHRTVRVRLRLRLLRALRAAPLRRVDGPLPGVEHDPPRARPGQGLLGAGRGLPRRLRLSRPGRRRRHRRPHRHRPEPGRRPARPHAHRRAPRRRQHAGRRQHPQPGHHLPHRRPRDHLRRHVLRPVLPRQAPDRTPARAARGRRAVGRPGRSRADVRRDRPAHLHPPGPQRGAPAVAHGRRLLPGGPRGHAARRPRPAARRAVRPGAHADAAPAAGVGGQPRAVRPVPLLRGGGGGAPGARLQAVRHRRARLHRTAVRPARGDHAAGHARPPLPAERPRRLPAPRQGDPHPQARGLHPHAHPAHGRRPCPHAAARRRPGPGLPVGRTAGPARARPSRHRRPLPARQQLRHLPRLRRPTRRRSRRRRLRNPRRTPGRLRGRPAHRPARRHHGRLLQRPPHRRRHRLRRLAGGDPRPVRRDVRRPRRRRPQLGRHLPARPHPDRRAARGVRRRPAARPRRRRRLR
ncbi:putative Bifunctional P-450/NADPH-P450 reductase [Streptomyces afghaniensis 772]|uniref:Putative Bifunctional P-450/NADPH-P450 reductase n=1 Tax=Streptomyces afghaniensis 772 TaxID=1283301 RepID=S4MJP1_9ACTN|nr:putative Bifunctional P-450/NADPH-P450 reductase [Streptomyces afghaniensis 772]